VISIRWADRPLQLLHQLAIAGTAVVWLSLLAGLLGRAAWPLDLFAHFRIQYAALFVVLALLLLVLRRFLIALAAIVGLVVSAVPLLPYLGASSNTDAANTAVANTDAANAPAAMFRVLTFNVWFRNPDITRVAAYIEGSRADAVVLQELTPSQAEVLRPLLPTYPHYYLEPSRMGAAVFTRWPVIAAESVPLAKGGGEGAIAARVQIDWRGSVVTVFGVHLNWPLGPRNSAFRNEELSSLVRFAKAQQGPLIVAGDFNLTPWSEYFRDALSASGLHDAALGFGLHRSWPAQFAPLAIRIDHCLLSSHWRSVSADIGPWLGSDHLPLVADLQLQGPPISR
jgi:endonuclease/exonuclease/phosphatase (EEP) superfamily protein YafD